jgi:hypothetical protein
VPQIAPQPLSCASSPIHCLLMALSFSFEQLWPLSRTELTIWSSLKQNCLSLKPRPWALFIVHFASLPLARSTQRRMVRWLMKHKSEGCYSRLPCPDVRWSDTADKRTNFSGSCTIHFLQRQLTHWDGLRSWSYFICTFTFKPRTERE